MQPQVLLGRQHGNGPAMLQAPHLAGLQLPGPPLPPLPPVPLVPPAPPLPVASQPLLFATYPALHSNEHSLFLQMADAFAGACGHGSQPTSEHPIAGTGVTQSPPQRFSPLVQGPSVGPPFDPTEPPLPALPVLPPVPPKAPLPPSPPELGGVPPLPMLPLPPVNDEPARAPCPASVRALSAPPSRIEFTC